MRDANRSRIVAYRSVANRRFEQLEPRRLLAVVISEFMAKNDSPYVDVDGDASDWIEIYNPTAEPIDMSGWALTDDANLPKKWSFPAVSLPANGYEVVFASDKNRRDPNEELHTNFKLASGGEYLALFDPSGVAASEFSPEYPEFQSNTSYGFPSPRATLIEEDDSYAYLVPTGDVTDWPAVGFNDSDWGQGTGAIGFDVREDFPNAGFEQANLSEWETSGSVSVQQSAFGAAPTAGEHFALLDSTGSGTTRRTAELFLELDPDTLDDVIGEPVSRVSAIKRDVTVDVGSVLEFDWQLFTNDLVNRDFGFISISDGIGVQSLASTEDALGDSETTFARETLPGTFRLTFPDAGTFTIGIGIAQTNNRVNDSALAIDNVTLDGRSDAGSSYRSVVTTDITEQSVDEDGSLWMRYEFDVANPTSVHSLQLDAKYDDGFVAYLNGEEVASQHAPAPTRWNSKATAAHTNRDAIRFESFALESGELRAGNNVLAIQALNHANDVDDLLWQARLVAIGPLANVPAFFADSTPGQPNSIATLSFVEPVQFDVPAGFYDGSIVLAMSVDTPDAMIRYTIDGSLPSATNGIEYSEPLVIDSSTVVRAIALRDGFDGRQITTASYLFVDDVVAQTRGSAIAAGFPGSWGGAATSDYAMDRDVIGPRDRFGGKYAATVRDDLLSVPTISLVMDQDALFGNTGIYSNALNRGEEWERPTSMEILYPNGKEGMQIDAGIRVQGGISRVFASKLSLRLIFREKYGESKLRFPLLGSDGPSEFDSISLRSNSGEHLVGRHFIRDEFLRRAQIATGNPSARGNFMHLYINGIYWGLYNPTERISAQFAVNHDGGQKEDYDVLNAGDLGGEGVSPIDGTREAWDELVRRAAEVGAARSQSAKTAALLRIEGKDASGDNDREVEAYLDIDNFIDYLIVNVFAGNRDWPHRNYYMYRKRGPDSDGFKFQVWDAEFTLDSGETSLRMSNLTDGPTVILRDLMTSDAFAVRFADRAEQLFSPGGAFYVNPSARVWNPDSPSNNVPASIYAQIADEARSPLVPESARWGDTPGFGGAGEELFTRDEDWETLVRSNLQFFASRSASFLAGLRSDGLYEAAPTFSVEPGKVAAGTRVQLNSDGIAEIYYTVDGSDPRQPNGTIANSALRLRGDIAITDRTTIRMRSRADGSWSALKSGTFLVDAIPADGSNLAISEINYNPRSSQISFGELDVDNDQFEFIELQNVGDDTVDLTGVRLEQQFSRGVEFEFGRQTLEVGERVVIPKSVDAFSSRYGAVPQMAIGKSIVANGWHYDGALDNSGDVLRVVASNGQLIQSVEYDDSDEWPERADGSGSSLEPIDPTFDLSNPANWRSSSEFGGSPGSEGRGPDNRIVINEVMANTAAPFVDQIELKNNTNAPLDLEHWYLSDSSNDYFKFQFDAPTVIAANGYWSLLQSDFQFEIDGVNGDDIYLIEADESGRPQYFVDRVDFGSMIQNGSLARWSDGAGRLYPSAANSFGRVNAGPQVGDIVISEIQASANFEGVDGFTDSRELEFVELYNRTESLIDLSSWQIAGDADFEFSEGTNIAAGSALTLVGFDPVAEPTKAALFQLLYQSNSVLVGPYSDTLRNLSGTVRLTQPLGDEVESQVIIDEVRYESSGDWPDDVVDADQSIHRTVATAFGSFATSWSSARATPGSVAFRGIVGDVNQDGTLSIDDVDSLCSAIRASELTEATDVDRDGIISIEDLEFLISTVFGTTAGDANLDGVFNSRDLVLVFRENTFEDGIDDNASWISGDWNCDGDFTTFDLVVAFRAASYSATSIPRSAIASAIAISDFDEEVDRNKLRVHVHEPPIQRMQIPNVQRVDSLFAS